MRVSVVTPPDPVVTLGEAKEHLRVLSDDEDRLIEGMVAAATGHIDGPQGWLGRCLGVQTLEAFLPSFGCVSIGLPYPPAVAVTEIGYVDGQGAQVVSSTSSYELRGNLVRPAWPNIWPQAAWRGADGETVRIRYTAGYEQIPAAIRSAILLMVGDLWTFRQSATLGSAAEVPMSTTVKALLGPFQVYA